MVVKWLGAIFGCVLTVRVKLTSERPRLVPAGGVGRGEGGLPVLLLGCLGVSLSLVVSSLSFFLCSPPLLVNPGETLT